MEQTSANGVVSTLTHDAQGRRLSRTDARSAISTDYLITDHLGSIDAIANSSGALVHDLSFDAWGRRRAADSSYAIINTPATALATLTPRGFTGHEMLDTVGLIHMNGRVYDPRLGRFTSADPIVQFPHYSQSFNHYSYVLNNPLNTIDPSGYLSFKDVLKIGITTVAAAYTGGLAWHALAGAGGLFTTSATLAATTVSTISVGASVAAGAIAGATAGFVSGAILSGTLKGAAQGAFTGAVFGGIGAGFNAALNSGSAAHIATGSFAGGVTSEINGGDFRSGAFLALSTSLLEAAAISMRRAMIAQSQLDPRNASGESVGFRGDGHKVGGGRFDSEAAPDDPCSVLGCDQGGPGALGIPFTEIRFEYAPGSWQDRLVEAFAGPHDYLNNGFWYNPSTGNIRSGISQYAAYAGEIFSATNIIFATPFVAASVVPGYITTQLGYLEDY